MSGEALVFENGSKYWVTYKDGSRFLMEARIDSHGVVDLNHTDLDLSIWLVTEQDMGDYTFEKVLV